MIPVPSGVRVWLATGATDMRPLWDRYSGKLALARDRVGKKPLYYGWCRGTLLFGSELKALVKHPQFDSSIDLEPGLEHESSRNGDTLALASR